MGVDWGQMAESFFEGSAWEESFSISKLSNVLGWYWSAYGALKTQLMIGMERKINFLPKYEWYYMKPTKVLLNGEGKIDLAKISSTTPWYHHVALTLTSQCSTKTIKTLEENVTAAEKRTKIAGGTTETHGTRTISVTLGNSVETILEGNKQIVAVSGAIQFIAPVQGIDLGAGASSLQLLPAAVTISGPIVNIG